MANTMILINSITVGAGGSSAFDFTSIPATYTDLCVKFSTRSTVNSGTYTAYNVSLNGGGDLTSKYVFGTGSGVGSGTEGSYITGWSPTSANTANVFGVSELYIPSYTSSYIKSIQLDGGGENNASGTLNFFVSGRWASTSAINRVTITDLSGNFVQHSTAYLYGIKSA
jgi:hypothetical protein